MELGEIWGGAAFMGRERLGGGVGGELRGFWEGFRKICGCFIELRWGERSYGGLWGELRALGGL